MPEPKQPLQAQVYKSCGCDCDFLLALSQTSPVLQGMVHAGKTEDRACNASSLYSQKLFTKRYVIVPPSQSLAIWQTALEIRARAFALKDGCAGYETDTSGGCIKGPAFCCQHQDLPARSALWFQAHPEPLALVSQRAMNKCLHHRRSADCCHRNASGERTFCLCRPNPLLQSHCITPFI